MAARPRVKLPWRRDSPTAFHYVCPVKTASAEYYIFYSKHVIPTLVKCLGKMMQPTIADFVDYTVMVSQICQSMKYMLRYIFKGGGKEVVAPVLWCGRHAIPNLRQRTCLSYYRRKVICQGRLFWHVAYCCWDHRVRFCLQLPLKDLGCRQAAINPASGPSGFDMSKIPTVLCATALTNAPQWPNHTSRATDAIINVIRFT